MITSRTVLSFLSLVITSCLLTTQTSYAHPHYWVEVSLTFDIDDNGKLLAIEQEWQFDEFVSTILLDEMETIVPGRPPASILQKESERIVGDLTPFNYYTELSLDHKQIPIGDPTSHFLKVVETDLSEPDRPRPPVNMLSLIMRFEFHKPLDLNAQKLALSVYDPTYYASFNFAGKEPVTLPQNPQLQCEAYLKFPTPDDSMVAYAFSLDQSQRDTGGLGKHFAEQLTVSCRPGTH